MTSREAAKNAKKETEWQESQITKSQSYPLGFSCFFLRVFARDKLFALWREVFSFSDFVPGSQGLPFCSVFPVFRVGNAACGLYVSSF
jgi:hypothetical protein